MINMNKEELNLCVELRHLIHKNAELSGNETNTINILKDFIKRYTSFNIVDKNGYFYAVYENGKDLPCVAVRGDIDALPIDERQDMKYSSINKGVSHKCGHDGHAAILCALAMLVEKNKIENKNIYLLFQPSEETGQGAKLIVEDGFLNENKIEEIYSLHNIPKFEKGSILIKNGVFACASKGMIIKLIGKPSHAAYPEYGINPSNAASQIIKFINEVPKMDSYNGMVLCTIINVSIGERAFGTSAGFGEIMVTIRAENEDELNRVENSIKDYTDKITKKEKLDYNISFCEEFPETRNNNEAVEKFEKIVKDNGFKSEKLDTPFRWSEDFGQYLKTTKGAMFGIGSGLNHPQLHTAEYDFPDDIIETASKFLYLII